MILSRHTGVARQFSRLVLVETLLAAFARGFHLFVLVETASTSNAAAFSHARLVPAFGAFGARFGAVVLVFSGAAGLALGHGIAGRPNPTAWTRFAIFSSRLALVFSLGTTRA